MPQPAAPTDSASPGDGPARQDLASRLADRRTHVRAILVFYQVDALLLLAFSHLGVGRWHGAALFSLAGLFVGLVLVPALQRPALERLGMPAGVLLMGLVGLGAAFGVGLLDPALAGAMLITALGIIPTAALQLPQRLLLPMCLVATAGGAALVHAAGGRLALPAGSAAELLVTALFLLWTLAKGLGVNFAGRAMRLEIDATNARLAEALERVRQLAEADALTGLPNRRHILGLLEGLARSRQPGLPAHAIALLDIDHFKQVNDGFGHAVGDAVLQQLAMLMRTALGSAGQVGRLGGEEFLLVWPAGRADVAAEAERLRATVAGHAWGQLQPGLRVTASIGLARARPGEALPALLERADRALYAAKHRGRDQVVDDEAVPAAQACGSVAAVVTPRSTPGPVLEATAQSAAHASPGPARETA